MMHGQKNHSIHNVLAAWRSFDSLHFITMVLKVVCPLIFIRYIQYNKCLDIFKVMKHSLK